MTIAQTYNNAIMFILVITMLYCFISIGYPEKNDKNSKYICTLTKLDLMEMGQKCKLIEKYETMELTLNAQDEYELSSKDVRYRSELWWWAARSTSHNKNNNNTNYFLEHIIIGFEKLVSFFMPIVWFIFFTYIMLIMLFAVPSIISFASSNMQETIVFTYSTDNEEKWVVTSCNKYKTFW